VKAPLARRAFLAYARTLARYHRYTVQGLHHVEPGRAALLVGYHGTPFAWDMFMLAATLHDRDGVMPHGIFHDIFDRYRPLRQLLDALGGVTRDGPGLAAAVERGEQILLLPGGSREAARDFRHRYRIDWGRHRGYLRLAARYRLPIIPVACHGVDDAYLGLNNGYELAKRLGTPSRVPLWFGIGLTGPWPVALPFPVPFTQVIGAPITDLAEGDVAVEDSQALERLHSRVVAAVQDCLDQARENNIENKGNTGAGE
jgi:1-acyl-sn-glycerol-3-phosphate acyltransferase